VTRLPIRRISAADFAACGWLADGGAAAGRPINDGTSLRIDGVGELQLTAEGGAPCLALFRAQPRDPRGPWQVLERHRLGTQTFVPMRSDLDRRRQCADQAAHRLGTATLSNRCGCATALDG
jgi:ureidoglycolate hydrolase